MSIADAVVLITIIALIYDGYRTGFVKSFFSIIKMCIGVAISVVCIRALTGKVSEAVAHIVPVVFIGVIGIVFGLLGALEKVFNLIDIIPVAKQMNRLLGLAAGAVKAVVIIWTLFFAIRYFADVEWVIKVSDILNRSEALLFVNKYNPLIHFIQR